MGLKDALDAKLSELEPSEEEKREQDEKIADLKLQMKLACAVAWKPLVKLGVNLKLISFFVFVGFLFLEWVTLTHVVAVLLFGTVFMELGYGFRKLYSPETEGGMDELMSTLGEIAGSEQEGIE